MRTLSVVQGSPGWHAARAACFTASEAPTMMGASKYQTRNQLLALKAGGVESEHSDETLRLFARGHETEAMARRIVESEELGEDLYPATITDEGENYLGQGGRSLLASLDGITLLGETIYEHKLWSESLAKQVRSGELDPHYYWQLEQQLLVSGAERAIFVTSDGTRDNYESMEYRAVPGRAEALIAGWKQFAKDLADYTPADAPEPVAVGHAPDQLPALRIEVTGMVTASNLEAFKSHALGVIGSISTELSTDEDFADAEATVKWCHDVESRLEAAKQHALSQTDSIEALFRAIDSIKEETRKKRLSLGKLVDHRKAAIREDIRRAAIDNLAALYREISEVHGVPLSPPQGFAYQVAEAMKGKKLLSALQNAADTTLAQAKVEANELQARISINIDVLEGHSEHAHLWPDRNTLLMKSPDDLLATVKAQIADAQEAEAARKAADDLRAELVAKKLAETEQARSEAALKPIIEAECKEPQTVAIEAVAERASNIKPFKHPPMKLGELRDELGFAVTEAFLASIGINPIDRVKNAVIYAGDYPTICHALIKHITETTHAWVAKQENLEA